MSHPELILPSDSISKAAQATLARYFDIVDDPAALLSAATEPLPTCLWSNPLKDASMAHIHYLKALGVPLESIDWMPGAFKADVWKSPGSTFPFTVGGYYVQEEIAMTAVVALDPKPGDRILDMCAAPGGKTAQIAVRLQERGLVVANELHAARLPSLTVTISRLGLTNVVTTQGDGRSLPLPNGYFDRVLVDAPCSGEGNIRRRQQPRPWRPEHGHRIAAAQRALLSRALDLVKPGGTVVYSTCTFAPEENEAVLNAVLGDRATVQPFDIPGLRGQPGLTCWQGAHYRSDLSLARRYFPHFNNTGGFFIAKLHRNPTQSDAASMGHETPKMPPVSINPIAALEKRFAIAPGVLSDYYSWSTGKRRLWLTHKTCLPPAGTAPQTLGIPLATHTNLGLKPSTAVLQRFGAHIQQTVVELPSPEATKRYLTGQSQAIAATVDEGYVHVRFRGFELGCGRYVNGQLHSQLPKTLRWSPTVIDTIVI